MTCLKDYFPLLLVLSELKNYQRQIILEALNSKNDKAVRKAICFFLKHAKSPSDKEKVLQCMEGNKKDFLHLVKNIHDPSKSKKHLTRIGGSLVGSILNSLIPILLKKIK